MFSTSGGIQYIGEYTGGYHEYIEGCLVHRRDIMMHVGGYNDACGGYQEYIRGCWGDTMSTAGDIMSTLGGCSVHWQDIMMHVGKQVDKIL